MTEDKPLAIELEINDKVERFVTPKRIKGVLLREATLIMEEIESQNSTIADLDTYMQFVCDVFGNQFTLSEFENGIDARDLMKTVSACTFFVMGQVTIASEMLTRNTDIADLDEKKT